MDKEIKKHLDNPNLRGMVTTKEMLSFPKVAKGVKAEYDERYQGYTWQVKADDGNIINYGERDYGEGHRLLTAHSKTGRDERGQLRREFNDRNFHNPAMSIIPQNQSYTWRVKANDGNILAYGSRKYEFDNEKIHRLATTHSQTERNERKAEEDRRGHPYHPVFNDLNFRKSANEKIIPQNQMQDKSTKDFKSKLKNLTPKKAKKRHKKKQWNYL
ncbi:hypothetical protein [uncultured Helicobacter sp.]|uniref:hypothetical protein n=1 Tax=uncultured Helicobacter sp. TaxID=175537 RepID=UPI00263354B0|nr:hypothetical protein [uncultured Helicobacter sp.]